MKTLKILLFFLIISFASKGQDVDSIFFIVDKNAKYVIYKEGKVKGDFEIEVKCNYYKETENIYDDAYAEIHFSFERNEETVEGNVISIKKEDLDKFNIVDVEWIAKQESREAIYKRISWDWWRKIDVIIFKEDLLSNKKKIRAYIVACGEGEIEW